LNKRVTELLIILVKLCNASGVEEMSRRAPELQTAYHVSYEAGSRMVSASIDMDFALEGDLSKEFDAQNAFMLDTLKTMVTASSISHEKSMGHILTVSTQLNSIMTISFVLLFDYWHHILMADCKHVQRAGKRARKISQGC
jgi:hypothetical protein